LPEAAGYGALCFDFLVTAGPGEVKEEKRTAAMKMYRDE
jgi:hypothetical protein